MPSSVRSRVLDCQVFIDCDAPANSHFFTALVQYIRMCSMNGCERSAFEACKLLASLDPARDPAAALLRIDYHAMCARDFAFVHALSASTAILRPYTPGGASATAPTSPLPHWASGANSTSTSADEDHVPLGCITLGELPNVRWSDALAYFSERRTEEARDALVVAMTRYPFVAMHLFSKERVRSKWPAHHVAALSEVLSHSHFSLQRVWGQVCARLRGVRPCSLCRRGANEIAFLHRSTDSFGLPMSRVFLRLPSLVACSSRRCTWHESMSKSAVTCGTATMLLRG